MIVIRKLFSKESDGEKNKKTGKKKAILEVGAGAGLVLKAGKIGKSVTKLSGKALENSKLTAPDKDIVKKKLLKSAKEQGIKIVNDPQGENAMYTGDKLGTKVRSGIAKAAKFLKKGGQSDIAKDLIRQVENSAGMASGSDKAFKYLGKDAVILGKGNLAEADVLSHELGHAQYLRKGRSKSIVGKVAHKLMPVSKMSMGGLGAVGSAVNGFKSGQNSVKAKREGKKEGAWNKVRAIAVPAAMAAPLLIGEGKASLNGLRAMKKAGASKELMNQSRKRLLAAWGTYAGHAGKNVIVGAGARKIGKGYEKLKGEKENK